MVPAGRPEGIPIGEHGQPRAARSGGVRSVDRAEAGGDLFGAPVDDVAGDEAARGLEGLDRETGAGGSGCPPRTGGAARPRTAGGGPPPRGSRGRAGTPRRKATYSGGS